MGWRHLRIAQGRGCEEAEYEKDDFEVRITEKGGKHYVYTRRVVTEIVLEGEAPV